MNIGVGVGRGVTDLSIEYEVRFPLKNRDVYLIPNYWGGWVFKGGVLGHSTVPEHTDCITKQMFSTIFSYRQNVSSLWKLLSSCSKRLRCPSCCACQS